MIALIAGLAAFAAGAQAATPAPGAPGATTVVWVNACQAQSARESNANVREACACTAGLFAGRMSDRQYSILGRIARHLSDEEGLIAEMRAMTLEGYSADEIARVGVLIAELGPQVDQVCGVLE
ncbi:hypothetical protein E5163_14290 [Marinicauda algicola]|uniref:Uncharacterized protein n=1 Tax=Marinicauda algicola TaxID=2029849 RepID=A0A4S2GXV2_9PROT|nr:hypothetical protein [Marinicauda algicola]TGY87602.1 hypothetical protein E5163_14290 [Marinicauda algicola]